MNGKRRNIDNRPHSLNILMISYWDFQDEGMQVTKRTPLYFAKAGHRVTFMVHSEMTTGASRQQVKHKNLRVLRFDMPMKWMSKIFYLKRIRQLILFSWFCLRYARIEYKKGRKPDLIYAAEADAVLIGSILKRFYRVPLVTRFYGVSRLVPFYDSVKKKMKFSGVRHLVSRLAMTRRADMAIVTDDGSQGLEILRAMNRRVRDIRFWRNGVDQYQINLKEIAALRSSLKIGDGRFVLLTVCRLDRWKGVDLAIRSVARIPCKIRKKIILLIVGQGPELPMLQKLTREYSLESNVMFVAAVAHKDIYGYFFISDIFLSLYRYSNVGNPLWEALNSGCCILTLNTGTTSNVICDGVNGKVVDYSSDEDNLVYRIADEIIELNKNIDLRNKLRQGARKYSKKNLWSWNERLGMELDALKAII